MANITNIQLPDGTTKNIRANGILFGHVDSTSTSTKYTATIPGVTEYYDGLTIFLRNGVVTSASGFTLNINGLGAKGSYSNMATGNPTTPTAPTRDTTIFNINYTMLFVYSTTLVDGGAWICYRGYDANTNTIGYQLRTNSYSLPMTSVTYRYRLFFQSADNAHWVPATNSTSTNATSARTVCQDPINPFGSIVYYGTTISVAAGSRPSASYLWQQYAFNLGYSFQKSPNYSLTSWKPVYLKCAPQTNGSAIIDSDTPFVQDLPTTEDGKIYIYLGVAYSTTNIELVIDHPVYCYKDGMVRLWTTAASSAAPVQSVNGQTGAVVLDAEDVGALPDDTVIPSPSSTAPSMDGTASAGSSTDYARADHVHPTDTSRQATLVSGTNIKTVGGTSILGSGNIAFPVTSVNSRTGAVTVVEGNGTLIGSTNQNDSDYVTPAQVATALEAHKQVFVRHTVLGSGYFGAVVTFDDFNLVTINSTTKTVVTQASIINSDVDGYFMCELRGDASGWHENIHQIATESLVLVTLSDISQDFTTATSSLSSIEIYQEALAGRLPMVVANNSAIAHLTGFFNDNGDFRAEFSYVNCNSVMALLGIGSSISISIDNSSNAYIYMKNILTSGDIATSISSSSTNSKAAGALAVYNAIPTKTSDLTNDSGYIMSSQAPVQSVNGSTGAVTITVPTKTSDLTNDSGFVTSDTKVTQTVTTTTDYTYWRGLCVGSSSSQAETGSLSTTTDQVRIFSNIRVQPSTGTVKATTFKGQLSGTIASSTTATTQASTDNSTKVATTAFVKSVLPAGLPSVSSSDNGKVLMVVNGAWAAASLPVYNGGVI